MKKAILIGKVGMLGFLVGILSLIQELNTTGFMLVGVSAFLLIGSNAMLSKLIKEARNKDKKSN